MKYYFSKYKFTTQLFFKKLNRATVITFSDCFQIQVEPYFLYSGCYFIHSIYHQDEEKTVYRTIQTKIETKHVNLNDINIYNQFFITIYKNRRKVSIFDTLFEGLTLKI